MSTTIQAELKFLYSSDFDPLQDFRPRGPFGLSILAIVGPLGDRGQESFNFILCTPEWFAEEHLPMMADIRMGRHFLFVREHNYPKLEKFVRDYCASCEGKTWTEVAEKLARLGLWEFEDYKPFPD
jgi:hypothetical protein